MAFELKGVAYPVRFANFQRNSRVLAKVKPEWNLSWKKEYAAIDEEFLLIPHSVLIRDNRVGVISTSEILIFDEKGEFKHFEGIGENTPVVFGRKAVAFIGPSYILNYFDYDWHAVRDEGIVPNVEEWGVSLLFKPSLEEILGVAQFTGGPQREPEHYYAYRYSLVDEDFPWDIDEEGSLAQAFLSNDGKKLILIQEENILIIDADNGKTLKKSEMEPGIILTASLDPADNLIVLFEGEEDEGGIELRAYSLSGEKLWSLPTLEPQEEQPPACGGDGRIYVVDARHLKCIINGEVAWARLLKSDDQTWVTITEDNHALALNGPFLCLYDPAGEKIFERLVTKDEEESFDAPVSIDDEGRIFVAGNNCLYCFQ
jgi:outer membrane protein assembly factor BamB